MGLTDLHTHSTFSVDGEFIPEQLVEQAKNAGISLFALTDHNSVRGVHRAMKAAERLGIAFISGVELDSVCGGTWLHILGYGIDANDPCFAEMEEKISRREQKAGYERFRLLRKYGLSLDREQVLLHANKGVITGEVLAEAALAETKNDDAPILKPYRNGGPRGDQPLLNFSQDYLDPGKQFYVPVVYPNARDNIEMIHRSGGIAVLAHPGASTGAAIGRDTVILRSLMDLGLDGIEVYTSYHSKETAAFYLDFAEKNHLFVTCGSDYHGKTKPAVSLAGAGQPDGFQISRELRKRINID